MEMNEGPKYAVDTMVLGEEWTVEVDTADEAREISKLNPGSSWYRVA